MKITAAIDRKAINHREPGLAHCMVCIEAPEIDESNRKPFDAVLVLDVSTSMSEPATEAPEGPTKIALMKESARAFVEQLTPRDRVGIVTFSTSVMTLVPVHEVTDAHREECVAAIGRIGPEASTDLCGGAIRGVQLLTEVPASDDRLRRVLLFTDGMPTAGIQNHAAIVRTVTGVLADLQGCSLSTFGYGRAIVARGCGNYDPELLQSIASAAGGNAYHAEGVDGILEAFGAELGSLRSAAASDVRIVLRPGKNVTIDEVMNDLTVRPEDDHVVIEVGNLFGGATKHVVIALRIPSYEKPFPREVLICGIEVTGTDVVAGKPFHGQRDLHARFVKPEEADALPDPVVEEQRIRILAARAVEEAFRQASRGDHHDAQETISRVHLLLVRLDTNLSRELAKGLEGIRRDVGDPSLFAGAAGAVIAAISTLAHEQRSGSPHLDEMYTTKGQDRTILEMYEGRSGAPGMPDPQVAQPGNPATIAPDPAEEPAPPPSTASRPSTGPFKKSGRKW